MYPISAHIILIALLYIVSLWHIFTKLSTYFHPSNTSVSKIRGHPVEPDKLNFCQFSPIEKKNICKFMCLQSSSSHIQISAYLHLPQFFLHKLENAPGEIHTASPIPLDTSIFMFIQQQNIRVLG